MSGGTTIPIEDLDEWERLCVECSGLLIRLERKGDRNSVDELFRIVHTIKGNAALYGVMGMRDLAHACEHLLDGLRQGSLDVTKPLIDELLVANDRLAECCRTLRDGGISDLSESIRRIEAVWHRCGPTHRLGQCLHDLLARDLDPEARNVAEAALRAYTVLHGESEGDLGVGSVGPVDRLRDLLSIEVDEMLDDQRSAELRSLLTTLAEESSEASLCEAAQRAVDIYDESVPMMGHDALVHELLNEALAEHLASVRSSTMAAGRSEAATMRVREEVIDQALHRVGDLITLGEVFGHLHSRFAVGTDLESTLMDFKRANAVFGEEVLALQDALTDVRMVSVRRLVERCVLIVRESAGDRPVEFHAEGSDATIDRRILDALEAPMTHILRNAVDHGIEAPDMRESVGKERQGNIALRIDPSDQELILSIVDDGRGIDRTVIAERARKAGLLRHGQELSDVLLTDIICTPGISSADGVSELSGRGVGMDVVRHAVEELGGRLGLVSEAGRGTTVRLQVPRHTTTRVVTGMVVGCGASSFVVPIDDVGESFVANIDERHSDLVERRGVLFPIVDLRDVFASGDDDRSGESTVFVQIEGTFPLVLAVDRVIGIRQVVLKNVDGIDFTHAAVQGCALLGDGGIAMVLNPESLRALSSLPRERS